MDENVLEIIKTMRHRPGVRPDKVDGLLSALDYSLPTDYLDFLMLTNGINGSIGELYLDLWKMDDLQELNKA